MIQFLKNLINDRKIKKFLEREKIEFNGNRWHSVNGFHINEFGYLLRHVTVGRLETFDDLEAIHQNFLQIQQVINAEMNKPLLREDEVFGIGRDQAVYNMRNLLTIVTTIHRYVELKRSL